MRRVPFHPPSKWMSGIERWMRKLLLRGWRLRFLVIVGEEAVEEEDKEEMMRREVEVGEAEAVTMIEDAGAREEEAPT